VHLSGAKILGANFSETHLKCYLLKGALNTKDPLNEEKEYGPTIFPKNLKVTWDEKGKIKDCKEK
jgi:hypothetical protein